MSEIILKHNLFKIYLGWRVAVQTAREALIKTARDNSKDPAKLYDDLIKIAKTTLSSKILYHDKEHFAKLTVDAVLRLKVLKNLFLDYFQIISIQH